MSAFRPDPSGFATPMKLLSHLVLSHSGPVIAVTVALGLSLTALVRISLLLTSVRDQELHQLREEGNLHAAAWDLDVAMRHAETDCARGQSPSFVAALVHTKAEALRMVAFGAQPGLMHDLANGYLEVAAVLDEENACRKLQSDAVQARRRWLDEQLTNVWVARLDELHDAVSEKDGAAQSIAVFAIWVGLPAALISLLLAFVLARRMSRMVKDPLVALSDAAKRVGLGDFQTAVSVEGPAELQLLAEDLERMRRQLYQLENLKQGFLASVSHELRTPLSKIREALALFEDGALGELEPRRLRVIRIARSACESEIRLVTTLLDLSRLRAGNPVQMKDGVQFDQVVQTALREERVEANTRGVELELMLDGPPPVCRLDPLLTERVIANLVRNAISVSKSGQRVTVRRSTHTDELGRPGPWLRLTVADQGPGVPPEIQSRLFEAFVTHPVPSAGKGVGIGLGLALAREVAQSHGGSLDLRRSDEEGSVFELWLPASAVADGARVGPTRGDARSWERPAPSSAPS